MDNWGCEFLDLREVQEFIPKPKEEYIKLPMSIISKIVDPRVNAETLIKDREYIDKLRFDILRYGMRKPAEITVTPKAVILTDGNHRYIECRALGYETFDVTIKYSDGASKIKGLNNNEMIKDLLTELFK